MRCGWRAVGEHGGDGAGGALGAREHPDGEELVARGAAFEFGRGLEAVVADGAHGHEGVGVVAAVGVALEEDVVGGVDHFDGGVVDVGVVELEEVGVVPVLDGPGVGPLARAEVGAGGFGALVLLPLGDGLRDVDILGEGAEVEELVVGEVVGSCGVGHVAAAVGVSRKGVGASCYRDERCCCHEQCERPEAIFHVGPHRECMSPVGSYRRVRRLGLVEAKMSLVVS